MRAVWLAASLLLGAALTGCLGGESTDAPVTEAAVAAASADTGNLPTRTPLDVLLASSTAWVRPGESATFTASSSAAKTYTWFLAPRPVATSTASSSSGGHHLASIPLGESTPSCVLSPGCPGDAPPARTAPAKADTGELQPGTYSEPLKFNDEGLYQFHCHPHPWMALNIVVKDGASASGTQHVEIVDGASQDEFRYVPDELEIAPGTKVVFWNNGTNMHTGTQGGFAWLIPGSDAEIEYAPSDAGDFDVLVIAKDAGTGRGEARVRLLVDPNKPDEFPTLGPFEGEFTKGVPSDPQPEAKDHAFTLDFPARTLSFAFEATSDAPALEPKVLVTLLQGEKEVASAEPSSAGEIQVEDLPAGAYTLRVSAAEGVLITYKATGEAALDLTPPESAPAASGGGHQH